MKRICRLLTALALLLSLAGLLRWPQAAADAAREGLALCGGVVVPALFPFFVLTSLAVSLGMAQLLGTALAPVLGPLFRVSRAGVGALALGLVGGYPVGAGAVRQLYQEGQCSKGEAERLLAFCNNCGPAFLLGAAGAGVFGSAQAGLLLLAGHWLGACSVGVLFRFRGEATAQSEPPPAIRSVGLAAAFTGAVQSAVRSTLNVCGYVVLFRVLLRYLSLTGTLEWCGALPNGQALAWGLLELTSGVNALEPEQSFTGAMVCGAFLMAFGGLSVQCQTLALLEGSGLDLRPALLGKLAHGGFAALWTWALGRLFPLGVATLTGSLPVHSWSWLPLAVTGGAWGVFLLALGRRGGRKSLFRTNR
ncbi:MAG: sporulation protein [Oscillospiraceae bacterium]|nr:sporulation protein [Oscillospiraceae bacterium]